MEQEELKRKLLGLWEKTTHNSKEYLTLLFDYYFDENYLVYKETDGKVVSAICGIPYNFGSENHSLKGLYLLYLSSEEGYRKKGVLSELLNNINDRVKSEFDFTFLVPHTELLEDYFGTQGYFSSFFILEERFTPLHDFRNDYLLSLIESDERIRLLKRALLDEINVTDNSGWEFSEDEIIRFIKHTENKEISAVNLCHTYRDLEYILNEDSLSKANHFVAYDSDKKITGVVFTQKDDIKRIRVVACYVADTCSYYALLDFIKRAYPDFSLSVNTSEPKFQTHSIIQQTYAAENPSGGDLDNTFETIEVAFNINRLLQPLGMVKLLRFDKILKYIAETRSDIDFKLYIRDYIPEYRENISDIATIEQEISTSSRKTEETSYIVYKVKGGKCVMEDMKTLDRSVLNLSVKETSELLLRKNDSSNLIMEAFGIPRLNLQMRLLPY